MKEAASNSFHDTFISILSLLSDRAAKVVCELRGHSVTPKSLPVLKQGFYHIRGKRTEVLPWNRKSQVKMDRKCGGKGWPRAPPRRPRVLF